MKVHTNCVQPTDARDDTEWKEVVISAVERQDGEWAVEYDGWTLWVEDHGIEPEVGDTIRMYGRGIGHVVRGIAINGIIVRYESARDMDARWKREAADRQARQKAEAAAAAAETEVRIARLPQNFQSRIAGFRQRNADFDWEHLPYELMVCEQAALFADNFKTIDSLKAWHALDWSAQKAALPGLDEGHSGNSFGAACRLAYLHLTSPDLVPQEHGALCPLVGCSDYGCWAITQQEAAA